MRGTGDSLSDIDLFVLPRVSSTTKPASALAIWAATIEGVKVILDRDLGPEGHELLKGVHVTGIVLDLHVLSPERLLPLFRWRNRNTIFDRDGVLTSFLADQRRHWTDEIYHAVVTEDLPHRATDFWLRYAKAYSYVMRNRLFLASRALWNMTSILAGVLRLRTGAVPTAIRAPLHYVEADLSDIEIGVLRKCLPGGSGRANYAMAVASAARIFDAELPQFRGHLARQLICRARPVESLEAVALGADATMPGEGTMPNDTTPSPPEGVQK